VETPLLWRGVCIYFQGKSFVFLANNFERLGGRTLPNLERFNEWQEAFFLNLGKGNCLRVLECSLCRFGTNAAALIVALYLRAADLFHVAR